MNCNEISVLVLTFNEAPNIARCLKSVAWAHDVLVVDSFSTDETVTICRQFPNVSVEVRQFDNHTSQWNFGLDRLSSPWAFCLDADYVCPAGLQQEIESLSSDCQAYFCRFRYLINGQPLNATLYPPRAVLFRKDQLNYESDGHTQLLNVSGVKTGLLDSVIDHDDRKPLSRWLNSQVKYAELEADKLLSSSQAKLGWKDRLRMKLVIAPMLTFFYCLFVKRLLLDGWPGLYYTLQRVYAELLLSLELLDRRLRRPTPLDADGAANQSS